LERFLEFYFSLFSLLSSFLQTLSSKGIQQLKAFTFSHPFFGREISRHLSCMTHRQIFQSLHENVLKITADCMARKNFPRFQKKILKWGEKREMIRFFLFCFVSVFIDFFNRYRSHLSWTRITWKHFFSLFCRLFEVFWNIFHHSLCCSLSQSIFFCLFCFTKKNKPIINNRDEMEQMERVSRARF